MDKTIIYELGNERFASPVELKWRDEPIEDGYYWFIDDDLGEQEEIDIVLVYDNDIGEFSRSVAYMCTGSTDYLTDKTGKWYGPIAAPIREPK